MVKLATMEKNGKIKIQELNAPELKEGEVLLKTKYSEVCGTDVHLSEGRLQGVPYPIIPGHVSTGEIVEINGIVSDIEGNELKIGDYVTFLDVNETCNDCWYCLVAKASTRCPARKVYGITYGIEDGLLGGWSEKILLKNGVKIIKLPENVNPKTFIAAGCGLPTAIHAVERAEVKLGDTVVIQGSGPVGLMSAIVAKKSGAFEVIMLGAPSHRLDIAKNFGVDKTINIDDYPPDDRIMEVIKLTNNRGADVTIEATGSPEAVVEGLKMTRDQGNFVVVGQYTDAGSIKINPHNDINKKHIQIRGSWGSDFSHFYLAVQFVSKFQDEFPWENIISEIYKLEDADKALEEVGNLNIMKAVISPN